MHDVTIQSTGGMFSAAHEVICRTCGYRQRFSNAQVAQADRAQHMQAWAGPHAPSVIVADDEQANERVWFTRAALADIAEHAAAVSAAMGRLEAALRRLS